MAHLRQQGKPAPPLAGGSGHRRGRAVSETDGADTLEPGLPREVPRAGLRRRRRRPQRDAGAQPAPRRRHRLGAGTAHAYPHPCRSLPRRQILDPHAVEEVTLRAIACADPDHAPGNVGRTGGTGENRRPNALGAPVGGGDAAGQQRQSREAERRRGAVAQQQGGKREEAGGGPARPRRAARPAT